jgi:hypothetical protein
MLRAAVCAGSKKVVCVSTMELLEPYAQNLLVDVQYKPLPSTAPGPLGCHLQEFICREFARLGLLRTVIARLGSPDCARWPLSDTEAVAKVFEVLAPGERLLLLPFPASCSCSVLCFLSMLSIFGFFAQAGDRCSWEISES